jgi:uncharacterized protein (DUF2252 family)
MKVMNRAQRRAWGVRQRRQRVRRVDQGEWRARPSRPDPIATLKQSDADRLPELLPIKIERMAASPFGFFRGAAPVMAADLARLPHTGIDVQICGDAHAHNVGAFAAPDGHLLFDLNDFDESIRGPWEWDLKRLATSLVLIGREAGDNERLCSEAAQSLVRSYRETMACLADLTILEVLRYQVRRLRGRGPVSAALARAERITPLQALEKLTDRTRRRFHDRRPLLCHVPDRTMRAVIHALRGYRDTLTAERQHVLDCYRPLDVAFKVVGTGSVGTRDYVVLFQGREPEDPLVLQVKQALPSCYAQFLPHARVYAHQGQRVIAGQRLMQMASDPFLGWATVDGRDFLVRQLADHKASVETEELSGTALVEYALVCGELLAKGHARSGDAVVIAGYCGDSVKLDRAMAQFAKRYAEQTVLDHKRLLEAIKSGAVTTVRSRSRRSR